MKNKKQNEFKNVIILAIVVAILGIIYRAVSNLDFSHNQGNTAQMPYRHPRFQHQTQSHAPVPFAGEQSKSHS